jgi:hypothetical protein
MNSTLAYGISRATIIREGTRSNYRTAFRAYGLFAGIDCFSFDRRKRIYFYLILTLKIHYCNFGFLSVKGCAVFSIILGLNPENRSCVDRRYER